MRPAGSLRTGETPVRSSFLLLPLTEGPLPGGGRREGIRHPRFKCLTAIALAVSLLTATAARADLSVQATVNPRRAQVGEPLSLTIEVNGAQNVTAPALSDLDGFDVQYAGPSTQVSIINGQISASVQHRYSLVPLRQGHFTLGPFTVEYQGKQYQTAAVAVDIGAANQPPPGPQAPAPSGQAPSGLTPPGQAPSGQTTKGSAGSDALRVTLSVPRQEVYLHEPIPVDVRLYVGNVRVADLQYPTLPGDGLSIDKFPEPSQQRQDINGETLQVVHFVTTVIPLRAGALTLGPASVRLNVLSRRRGGGGFNDPFFERFFQNDPFNTERHPTDVRSDPVTLNVLPLPEQGKPPGFSGAVGNFALQVTAAPTELNAGDPITLHMTISGTGNLAEAQPPALTNAESFRTYEARAKTDGAERSYEQVLIPNDANVHAIPPVRFSYFDPQARQYRTLQSQPIALVVRPPQNAPRAEIVTGGAPAARGAPEEKLGRDIVYIKDDPGHLTAPADAWYRSVAFLLWQPVPLLLFAAAVWHDRRRQRFTGDERYARFTRAGRHAKRALAAAESALAAGNRQQFYDAVSRTMQEYLAAKLDLPPGAIDADAVARRGVADECTQRVRDFLATCEQVRFAPGAGDGDMRGTLALAQDVIKQLERTRRAVPMISAAILLLLVAGSAHAVEPPASPQTTFFHANALYKDGQFTAAAAEYEQLLRSGLQSGNVYFNLGNAYFKAGQRGKAILNYERARRLMPSDPDLDANLVYARSLTGAETCAPPVWERVAFPVAHRIATGQLVWLTSALYTLLLLGLAGSRLWPRRPRWLLYAGVALAALVAVTSTSLAEQVLGDDWQRQAVVIASGDTPARFEPADNGTVHFSLKEGALVRILDTRQGWLQIARCDGRRGWLPKDAVEDL